ncbi:YjbR protein [Anseongella ginsenosidimutans]|uniref:YjbR protein n=1 Tax=Anseongella ginsenosidimutans TaxID=496056 RepID=A0A4R3KUS0_9SPHI|nr:MmcQ/YjbR family DNA-binding protein [Anseongella ginsenosidimutans]QEC51553.1 MmcQ/YjbR family DNA-binding protein [Anseongella ginsenosidimutans]TCS88878.1 YjbR protein [Anseongella ginsenosidimutans]
MTIQEFRNLALSFPETEESPHFDRAAFKVVKKRIFATLHERSGTANLKLGIIDQAAFSTFNREAIYPVPNKWGQQGWTTFELADLPPELVSDALETAYLDVWKPKPGKK